MNVAAQLRAQDLNAHHAAKHCKPSTLEAVSWIHDGAQLFHADILVLAHAMLVVMERHPIYRTCDKELAAHLADMQDICHAQLIEELAA